MNNFVPSPAITKMSMSIRCPLTKVRIKDAFKGINCKHAQAFDLGNYAQTNFKYRKLLCPVCGEPTSTLRSDPLTQMIVDRADRLFPLDKFKDLTREDTIALLTSELKAAQNLQMDEDMKNDLDYVYVRRRSL